MSGENEADRSGKSAETQDVDRRERNRRVSARYDELARDGKHGHYETMFRVVHEEVERERAKWQDLVASQQRPMHAPGYSRWLGWLRP